MKLRTGAFLNEPYHIINISFAGVIILIWIYSGIFSAEKNNYPIKSACGQLSQSPCKSAGLSRSFSEIVRFNFIEARHYNKYGLRIFSFFFIQFFLRGIISFILYKKYIKLNLLLIFDSAFSTGLYFYCFWGVIV